MDKLICAGKNYLDHAQEMKEGIPEKPVLFLKPPSVLKVCPSWDSQCVLQWPHYAEMGDIHYECELVFLIAQNAYDINLEKARNMISHVSVGLDMTHRRLQKKAKEAAGPWETSKVFPDAAIIGPWIPIETVDIQDLKFEFALNGELRQQGHSADMRLNPLELMVYASQHFPLCAGDILFTGTPAGVGSVKPGDRAKVSVQNQSYGVCWIEA